MTGEELRLLEHRPRPFPHINEWCLRGRWVAQADGELDRIIGRLIVQAVTR